MDRTERIELTTLCLVRRGEQILLQNRVKADWQGYALPGGHVEPEESFTRSVIREVWEETGLTVSGLRLCGVKQWTHQKGNYRYVVLLYIADRFTGTLRSSDEGRIFWVSWDDLTTLPLADGFESMLQVFLNEELTENYHWFDGEWRYENL